jgi:two-component system sensor histidine kinase DctS
MLVLSMFSVLLLLAGRYEASQVQTRLDRDASDATSDIRAALTRNAQTLQALQFAAADAPPWRQQASTVLRDHRELMRLEWRNSQLKTIQSVDTPYRAPVFKNFDRGVLQPEVAQACSIAKRQSSPAYSNSSYIPQSDGMGLEIMDVCLPVINDGQVTGYTLASYALNEILINQISPALLRSREISFTEADGTRLAVNGMQHRGSRLFTGVQLLDLPGHTMVLRVDSWRAAPDVFPNVLTALVMAMAMALVTVLTCWRVTCVGANK